MDSLADMLRSRSAPEEPAESKLLKAFVKDRFNVVPGVVVTKQNIRLTVPNAALAGSLRLLTPEMQKYCKTNQKIFIRIE